MKRRDIPDKDVCLAYKEWQKKGEKYPYEILAEKFGCDEKLAYRACERTHDNGLIDYGVSLRTGWLTDKGKELLK